MATKVYRCNAGCYPGDKPHIVEIGDDGVQRRRFAQPAEIQRCKKEIICEDHQPPVMNLTPEVLIEQLQLPGFTYSIRTERWSDKLSWAVLQMKNDDGVTIEIHWMAEPEPLTSYSMRGHGHTSFTTSQGTRTFDRTGVEDSFYVSVKDDVAAIRKTIERQLEKIAESRARISNSVPVPGIGFLVTPEAKASVTALLKAGKSHSFTPSGFGTGYRLSAGKRKSSWDRRASSEMEAFFDVSPIWLQTLDCD
jgi:hypothetical protein